MANVLSLFAMPPKTEKGRREAKEVAEFVRELYAQSGFSSWGEFARAAGVAAATISDWKRAENATSGYGLLKLIRAAGWQQAEMEDHQRVHLESLEEKADEALTGIANILDLLRGAPGQSDADAPRGSP